MAYEWEKCGRGVAIVNADCIKILPQLSDDSVDLILTDVPYGEVNRGGNGLRKLDKGDADVMTFEMCDFLNEIYRVSKSTIIVFCGQGQFSEIQRFFDEKQKQGKGTVRQIVWKKTNPSPMNGEHIYLSGIENAVWFKKRGGTFNAHCKNTVFDYPTGRSKKHPTEKNHSLLRELLLDNSNENDVVLDPCMGSGAHGVVSVENNRKFIGIELKENYFSVAKEAIVSAIDEQKRLAECGYNPYQE